MGGTEAAGPGESAEALAHIRGGSHRPAGEGHRGHGSTAADGRPGSGRGRSGAGQGAVEQAREHYQIHAAELAAARHERDAALAEVRRQARAAAEAARDRDQLRQSSQAQIAIFEDALAGLRMLAQHSETDHARILDERDEAQAELDRVRAAVSVALASCERALGSGGDARLIQDAAVALHTVVIARPRPPLPRATCAQSLTPHLREGDQ